MSITIDLKINKKDLEYIKKMPEKFKQGVYEGMKLATIFAEGESKKRFNTPGNLRVGTGRLRNSIVGFVTKDNDGIVGSIGSDVIYARIHEEGGIIKPKLSKYLKFQLNGQWISVKQVDMPARPYLEPAITENIDKISDIITNSIVRKVDNE